MSDNITEQPSSAPPKKEPPTTEMASLLTHHKTSEGTSNKVMKPLPNKVRH